MKIRTRAKKKAPLPAAQKTAPWCKNLRYLRRQKSEASRSGSDLRGSHTHTLVLDPNDRDNVYIYVSGTSFVVRTKNSPAARVKNRTRIRTPRCFASTSSKFPWPAPQDAKIVSSPRVFIDLVPARERPSNGGTHAKKNGKAGGHGPVSRHTVYSAIGLRGSVLWKWNFAGRQGSRAFEARGRRQRPNYSTGTRFFSKTMLQVVFTDEWGGGLGARARERSDNWGRMQSSSQRQQAEHGRLLQLPAAQGDSENCVAHNGSLISGPGRDIEVQAWYQGGVSVMDFTTRRILRNAYSIAGR